MRLLPLILLVSFLCFTRTLWQVESGNILQSDCPPTRLAWLPSAPDSTISPFALDSIGKATIGRWELVKISGGWSKPHPPKHPTEIQINQSGKGRTYINGRRVGNFKITLSTRYGYIRCVIPERGTPLFNLSPRHKGRVFICQSTMFIGQDLGDGETFIFKRVTN